MSYKITISMKNNISGVLHYESSLLDLTLPVEHSGDYSVGFLVFIYRDSNIEGNINAWFAGWRHSFLADFFAFIGFLLIFLGIIKLYGI